MACHLLVHTRPMEEEWAHLKPLECYVGARENHLESVLNACHSGCGQHAVARLSGNRDRSLSTCSLHVTVILCVLI